MEFTNTFCVAFMEPGCQVTVNSAAGGIFTMRSGGSITINSPAT